MKGLEIVMNIDTLEIFEVIDHDQKNNSDVTEEKTDSNSIQSMFYQMTLFE